MIPYLALKVFLWMFSATILRPLTSARNYATIACRKSKFKRYNEMQKPMKESCAWRKKRQPLPKRVSGDGSAPPRLSIWFSCHSFSWRVLGCGARARSAKVCGAATAAPQCIKAALVYAKHTPRCQIGKNQNCFCL